MKKITSISVLLLASIAGMPIQAAGDETAEKSFLGILDKKMMTTMSNVVLGGLASGAGLGVVVSAFAAIKKAIMKRANTQIGVIKINELSTSDQYIKELQTYVRDSTVKAILLMIQCSDGYISVANTLYNELQKIKKIKPVIALIENQCSAAGYYVAVASDIVIASPLAQISALNVQYVHSYIQNPHRIVLDKKRQCVIYGEAQQDVINTNQMPCVGSLYCALTDAERQAMQAYLGLCYEQFCTDVAYARSLSLPELSAYAQIPVLTGMQARTMKLVDQAGTFSDAKQSIRQLLMLRRIRITGSMVFIYPKDTIFPFDILESIPKPVLDIMARMVQGVKAT